MCTFPLSLLLHLHASVTGVCLRRSYTLDKSPVYRDLWPLTSARYFSPNSWIFFFFRLMTAEMWWKKKIPVYLRLWNTEVLLYSGGQTCEPISRRRTFDQHVESAVIKDVSQRRAEPLLHHQLLCAGLETLNVGRRNIWHLCGGRLCNVPDNNTRVLGICNPISKASESPQPAIFFITNFFFFSWSVSVFFFLSKSTWADDSCTVVYLLPIWNFNHVATLLHLFEPYFYTGNAFFYLIFRKTHIFYFYCFLWLNFHHDSCAVRLTELH